MFGCVGMVLAAAAAAVVVADVRSGHHFREDKPTPQDLPRLASLGHKVSPFWFTIGKSAVKQINKKDVSVPATEQVARQDGFGIPVVPPLSLLNDHDLNTIEKHHDQVIDNSRWYEEEAPEDKEEAPGYEEEAWRPPIRDPMYEPQTNLEISSVNSNRIVNGELAVKNEFPWMAFLYIQWSDKLKRMCGGSLIFSDWVITAAHCVLRFNDTNSLWTPLVQVNLGTTQRNVTAPVSVMATRIVIYPTYSLDNDLALIKLPKPLNVTTQVRPVLLPLRNSLGSSVNGLALSVAGWGRTEEGVLSNDLRKLDDRVGMDPGSCRLVFGPIITAHHFCTTSPNVKHICMGDSGGPVMAGNGSQRVLQGVVSFVATANCTGTYPDGHTAVVYFLNWIQNVTGKVIS
ncbi:brachyurin-like [Procambarus clarkii]|uniref:brachyurin-like n=1 Tax=Procambarus clarkii TaxID=6728 RepID=UPI001E677655|nr:brachyurin-like [Procambarus clarkii]